MTAMPSGLVAFLLTDIEGSSRLWETHPAGMRSALAEHDRLLRHAIGSNNGHVFATAGDSIAAAFHDARDAVRAAVAAQTAMSDLVAEGEPIRVRMAVHAGEAEERDGDYFGQVLNRCGRLRDAAHGGQMVVSRTVHELLAGRAPPEVDLIDLGEHRLRDLERPEWIFQVAHPSLPSSFPRLRTLTRATTNFPVQLTSFVGRDQEMEEVAKLMRGSRLVTLTGVGGSGKTRLAMQAAATMASEFTDGVWLVDLAPISEPELVVQQVAAVFGVREEADHSLTESLREHLRTRQTLLVLDNCEHVIDSACRVVAALLGGAQSLRIMATSRESLHLPGEVAYVVPPLGIPDPHQPMDPKVVGRFDAVRLFANRAESARPGFRLTSETTAAALEICRRLDGIPLAIELAAARLASLTPQQIAGHLDRRFRLLSGGRRGVLPRQETLQATIDWSYALLNDSERLLFLRLAVFRGDFSLEAAQRIVAGEGLDEMDLLEVLPRLIDKSLVVAEPARGEMRYRLLETLRQYAADHKDAAGARPQFETRHALYFLELAEDGAANLRSAKHEEVLERLKIENDNLREALRWCLAGGELETGMRIAAALYRFWLYTDNYPEGVRWLQSFLSSPGEVPDQVRARALLGVGILEGDLLGNQGSGVVALRQAVDIYRGFAHDDNTLLDYATALNGLGVQLVTQGDLSEAEACYEKALEVSRALDLSWGVSVALGNLGQVAARDGRTDEARARFDEALAVSQQLASPRLIGDANARKATFERDWGKLEDSVAAYEQAIRSYTEAGYLTGATWARVDMGIALLRRGELARAVELFLPNAAAVMADLEVTRQASALIDLALSRAEIDAATGHLHTAAVLIGFVDRVVEAGFFEDYRHRFELLRAGLESEADPDQLETWLSNGRGTKMESIGELIASDP